MSLIVQLAIAVFEFLPIFNPTNVKKVIDPILARMKIYSGFGSNRYSLFGLNLILYDFRVGKILPGPLI
jgi:hypothetical protein